jgi:hypothetical protein
MIWVSPPFSPGFFARGQLSPLRNVFYTNDLRQKTTDIENYQPVVLFGGDLGALPRAKLTQIGGFAKESIHFMGSPVAPGVFATPQAAP